MTAPASTGGNSGRFQPGQSGNPAGRRKGSRNKLTELFYDDLYAKWQEKGAAAIEAMIADRPGDFVKCVASQMPKELSLNNNAFGDLTESELADILALVRSYKAQSAGDGAGSGAEETTRH